MKLVYCPKKSFCFIIFLILIRIAVKSRKQKFLILFVYSWKHNNAKVYSSFKAEIRRHLYL